MSIRKFLRKFLNISNAYVLSFYRIHSFIMKLSNEQVWILKCRCRRLNL